MRVATSPAATWRYSGHGVATTSADAPRTADSGGLGQLNRSRSVPGKLLTAGSCATNGRALVDAATGTAQRRSTAAACRCRACRSGPRRPTVLPAHVAEQLLTDARPPSAGARRCSP